MSYLSYFPDLEARGQGQGQLERNVQSFLRSRPRELPSLRQIHPLFRFSRGKNSEESLHRPLQQQW